MAKPKKRRDEVFLNIPYDNKFEKPFVAYIAGISAFGLVPRAVATVGEGFAKIIARSLFHLRESLRVGVADLFEQSAAVVQDVG